MTKKEKKELAEKILKLEVQCQYGIKLAENMDAMEKIAENLSLEELFELASYIETRS